MGYSFELIEGEEARGALNRVDGAEDAGKGIAVRGIFLEHDQILVKAIEVLVTLD